MPFQSCRTRPSLSAPTAFQHFVLLSTLLNPQHLQAVIQGVDGLLVPSSIDVPTAKAASGKRRLQQTNWAGQRAIANQWSGMNTQAAIQAAASGHIPTAYATRAGQANAVAAAASCLNCLQWNVMY